MSLDPITVRLCVQTDLPLLQTLEPRPADGITQLHLERQAAGDYFFAVALRAGQPLGTCALDCRPSPLCPELTSLWVHPQYRRQGAAQAMTTFLEQVATDRGFVEVFLRVNPENEAAIPMYIGLDYSPTGDHALALSESPDPEPEPGTQRTDAVYRKSLRAS